MNINKHPGFVWSVDGDEITIQLRTGGRIKCKNTKGFKSGDRVAVIPNLRKEKVIALFSLTDADIAVKCGSDPIFDAAENREPETTPINDDEEIIHYGNENECGESDDVYGNPYNQ